jgi:hypothetical protein
MDIIVVQSYLFGPLIKLAGCMHGRAVPVHNVAILTPVWPCWWHVSSSESRHRGRGRQRRRHSRSWASARQRACGVCWPAYPGLVDCRARAHASRSRACSGAWRTAALDLKG